MIKESEISMKFHPRAFSAFGSDLVTNDEVALTELVKNSYDAYASCVAIIFGSDSAKGQYIEIIDDGLGMTQEIVKNAWAVIATPYKMEHPSVERNGKKRMVSGNKGLGRFSAARLGKKMQIVTYNKEDDCFSAEIDWEKFIRSESIDSCKMFLKEYSRNILLKEITEKIKTTSKTGTIIKIYDLNDDWTDTDKISLLKASLARLVSPFDNVDDFSIVLYLGKMGEPIKIESHPFIKNPVYSISGEVDNQGNVEWLYKYAPKGKVLKAKKDIIDWKTASQGFDRGNATLTSEDNTEYICGAFSFEIRAWDLDTDSVADIHETFNIKKREIRQTISHYKGLSVYRDNILVLPKSEATKDWLGIDIRRVSALGKRLSTSQIVGILSITSENNPELKDTTDREKLVDTDEYKQFCKITESIILTLENLRNLDKKPNNILKNPTLTDLLSPLEPSALESKIELMIQGGGSSEDILDAIHEYSADTEKNLNELNDRLIYYAQTASLGSIAVVIMHEIRSGMTVIKRFLNRIKKLLLIPDERTREYFEDAEVSHQRLLEVANSFAPLYKRDIYKEKHKTQVVEAVKSSVRLIKAKKEAKDVNFDIDINRDYICAMHIGEFQTILINLLDNACYWLRNTENKKIRISTRRLPDNKKIELVVSDNGTGVIEEEKQKIFQPGVTAKPQGIGMGLVIVTELLNNHNCKIRLETPGEYKGATFVFDIPIE